MLGGREPPATVDELMARANALAGATLGEIAAWLGRALPADLTRAKGVVGRLIEDALGAPCSSASSPDFAALDIELKTVPVDRYGRPRGSTFVCRIPLLDMGRSRWIDSRVKRKLARVLWLPVEAERDIALAERRVLRPILWSPGPEEEAHLRADFEELADLIASGWVDTITAHRGKYLQVRPKAANARARTICLDDEGGERETLPRGFYLRRVLIARILADSSAPSRR